MDRTPTLAGRFGGLKDVCPPSVRDTRSPADRQAQETLDHRKEQMMKMRIAVIASVIVALIALALATRVAAQPADTRVQIESRTVTSFVDDAADERICEFVPIVMTGALTQ
jgi:uncharacterized membrane protein YvbJ